MKLIVALLVSLTYCAAVQAQEGWDMWDDKTQMPPDDQLFGLPIEPMGENIITEAGETADSPFDIDVGEVKERDGLDYKALQWTRDAQFEVTVPTDTYLIGLLGQFYPKDTIDPVEFIQALRLASVEIDGELVEIDDSYLLRRDEFPFEGFVLGLYNVFPRFTTPGKHTYVQTYQQTGDYFVDIPFEQMGPARGGTDPSPEFEGRRAYVPERIGEVVDGKIVFSYDITVVDKEEFFTAVAEETWGKIKRQAVAE